VLKEEEKVCCLDVVEGRRRREDEEVCQQAAIRELIVDGPSVEQYEQMKGRLRKFQPKDDRYEGCNAAQRRLILYGLLHRTLFTTAHKGQRDIMPSCIKQAVREAHPDEGLPQHAKGGEGGTRAG
jgi:hypothetical protein